MRVFPVVQETEKSHPTVAGCSFCAKRLLPLTYLLQVELLKCTELFSMTT